MRDSSKCRIFTCILAVYLLLSGQRLSAQATSTSTTLAATPSAGSTPASTASSPTAGITPGTAPIETTLFAYRALRADATAISGRITTTIPPVAEGVATKVIVFTQTDLTGFLQWRSVIDQIDAYKQRVDAVNASLGGISYVPAVPLPFLSIGSSHSPQNFTQSGTGTYTIVVSNSASSSATVGRVTVTETVPFGLTVTSITGSGWRCNPPPPAGPGDPVPPNSCFRDDPLAPGASYPSILISVNVAANAPATISNVVTVSGGSSSTNSTTDSTTVNPPTAPRVGGGRFAAPLPSTGTTTTTPTTPAPATPPPTPFATALSAIPTLVGLAQFLATAFAVNETLSPSQGAMTDTPLINSVSAQLRALNYTVYVPSAYIPSVVGLQSFRDLRIWRKLAELEDSRELLATRIAERNGMLTQAYFVTQNPTKYSAGSVNDALLYSGRLQSALTYAQAVAATVDTFDASLFGTQIVIPSQISAQAPANSASSTPAASSAAAPAATPASTPAAATTAATPSQLSSASALPASTTSTTSVPATGITLTQLISAELLAAQIYGTAAVPADPAYQAHVYMLALHSLESGGSQLVKGNTFIGTRYYFSGGAAADFSLYGLVGQLSCSGTVHGYRGFIREKDVQTALYDPVLVPSISDYGCGGAPVATVVAIGMTVAQVTAALGPPNSMHKGGTVYDYKGLHKQIIFSNGQVVAIMDKF
jgi:uncharacterized repeat protein (TIGR01451 family)